MTEVSFLAELDGVKTRKPRGWEKPPGSRGNLRSNKREWVCQPCGRSFRGKVRARIYPNGSLARHAGRDCPDWDGVLRMSKRHRYGQVSCPSGRKGMISSTLARFSVPQ